MSKNKIITLLKENRSVTYKIIKREKIPCQRIQTIHQEL